MLTPSTSTIFLLAICFLFFFEFNSGSQRFPKFVFPNNRTAKNDCVDAPVAVYFTGGLGNHLFCAAFGIALSLNRSGTINQLVFGAVPPHDLRYSQVLPVYSTLFSALNITSNLLGIVSRWAREGRPVTHLSLVDSSDFCRLVNVPKNCGTVQVNLGYFQNVNFFLNEAQTLYEMFKVPKPVQDIFFDKFQLLSHSSAIHIRRGDYVSKSEFYNLLPLEYFEAAIERLRGQSQSLLLIFSDDIDWVKRQPFFSNLTGVVFVDEPDTLLAFYFMILASGEGIVCSNSTFCWWVAFLSDKHFESQTRLVIFPERWDVHTTLSGVFDQDCGSGLVMPYMTLLSGY